MVFKKRIVEEIQETPQFKAEKALQEMRGEQPVQESSTNSEVERLKQENLYLAQTNQTILLQEAVKLLNSINLNLKELIGAYANVNELETE